jgi:hypothetical protein
MSNSQLLKAAMISSQKSKRGAGIARVALVQIRQPLQGQSSVRCVALNTGCNVGCRLAEQIYTEYIIFLLLHRAFWYT